MNDIAIFISVIVGIFGVAITLTLYQFTDDIAKRLYIDEKYVFKMNTIILIISASVLFIAFILALRPINHSNNEEVKKITIYWNKEESISYENIKLIDSGDDYIILETKEGDRKKIHLGNDMYYEMDTIKEE